MSWREPKGHAVNSLLFLAFELLFFICCGKDIKDVVSMSWREPKGHAANSLLPLTLELLLIKYGERYQESGLHEPERTKGPCS